MKPSLPDLATIDGIDDVPEGLVTWGIFAVRIPGFVFNEFNYDHLSDRLWEAYAADFYSFRR